MVWVAWAAGARWFEASPLETVSAATANANIGDLNGDGMLDIVRSNDAPDPKMIPLNDGKGRFMMGARSAIRNGRRATWRRRT